MALTYDITDCPISEEERKDRWDDITHAIFSTMTIGLGHWTKDNLDEVEARLVFAQKINGSDYEAVITLLPKLVGLRTNVFNEKYNEWIKKYVENDMRYIRYQISNRKKLAAKENVKE